MGNHTVNDGIKRRYPEKITERPANGSDCLKISYIACGKEPDEKKKMQAKKNERKPEYSLIEHLRKNGEIIEETDKVASIKAYSNRETTKSTRKQNDLTH